MDRISIEKNRERIWAEKGWADSLHTFAKNGDYLALEMILNSADIFEEDENGETALQIAERQLRNYKKCVNLLRKKEKECYEFDENFLEESCQKTPEKFGKFIGSTLFGFCLEKQNMNSIISISEKIFSPIEIVELPSEEHPTNCLSTS
jgi:hypothetical protein